MQFHERNSSKISYTKCIQSDTTCTYSVHMQKPSTKKKKERKELDEISELVNRTPLLLRCAIVNPNRMRASISLPISRSIHHCSIRALMAHRIHTSLRPFHPNCIELSACAQTLTSRSPRTRTNGAKANERESSPASSPTSFSIYVYRYECIYIYWRFPRGRGPFSERRERERMWCALGEFRKSKAARICTR